MKWIQCTAAFCAFGILVLQSDAVPGMTCFGGPSACAAFSAASMVFIGTVVNADPPLPQAERTGQKIQVLDKAFKGVESGILVHLEQTSQDDWVLSR